MGDVQMRFFKKSKVFGVINRWIILILCVSIVFVGCFLKVKPFVFTYAKSMAETIILNAANQAILKVLDESNIIEKDIIDIRKTSYDPLAKKMRKWINDEKIKGKVLCCASVEKPLNTGKVIGSNAFVPSSAGILIASYVFKDVINNG